MPLQLQRPALTTKVILKKTWCIINELRGKRNSSLKPKFIIDNQQITNRRVIANEFNRYFVSLAPKLNDPDDQ